MSEIKLHFVDKKNTEEKLTMKYTDLKGLDDLPKGQKVVQRGKSASTNLKISYNLQVSPAKRDSTPEPRFITKPSFLEDMLQFGLTEEPVEKKAKFETTICPFCKEEINSIEGSPGQGA